MCSSLSTILFLFHPSLFLAPLIVLCFVFMLWSLQFIWFHELNPPIYIHIYTHTYTYIHTLIYIYILLLMITILLLLPNNTHKIDFCEILFFFCFLELQTHFWIQKWVILLQPLLLSQRLILQNPAYPCCIMALWSSERRRLCWFFTISSLSSGAPTTATGKLQRHWLEVMQRWWIQAVASRVLIGICCRASNSRRGRWRRRRRLRRSRKKGLGMNVQFVYRRLRMGKRWRNCQDARICFTPLV